jgi:transposase
MTICEGVRMRARKHVENYLGNRDKAIKSACKRFHPYDPTTLRAHLRSYEESGSDKPRRRRGARAVPTMLAEHQNMLIDRVLQYPQSYVDELQDHLEIVAGHRYSQWLILRVMHRRGYNRKAITRIAKEQDAVQRAQFRQDTQHVRPDQWVFGDESHLNRGQARRKYGWALHGAPCYVKARGVSGKGEVSSSTAFVAFDGCLNVKAHEEIIDGNIFLQDLEEVLKIMRPYPHPRSVLCLDGAGTHLRDQILALIHNVQPGVLLFFLPPYSYDFNPIELIFNLAKTSLRRANVGRLSTAFENAILDSATPTTMCALFRKCGYPVTDDEEAYACR